MNSAYSGVPLQQALWMGNPGSGPGQALSVGLLANNKLHYLQPDHLGSPRVVIEVARDVPVWTWDVKGEAFGNTAPDQNPDGDANSFVFDMRFPGQQYDSVSGLNYNYFRDGYEPGTGRYSQSDPIGLAGGLNTYAYVEGDPLRYIDPLGLKCGSGQVTVWAFKHGVPRPHCESSANPSGNLPFSNPTGEAAFLHPNTNTPKGKCQTKCTADFVLPGAGTIVEKGVDLGLAKLFFGSALVIVKSVAKVATFIYDVAALDQCIKTCKSLDGCE